MNGKQDPTQAVASGIFQINTAVSTFQRLVNTLGTPKDTPELRDKLHKTRLHIGQLVKDTSAKLKQASETDHRVEVSASKKKGFIRFDGFQQNLEKRLDFYFMGMLLFSRKYSFSLILGGGLFRRHIYVDNNSFCRLYRCASLVVLIDDSDSGSNSDSTEVVVPKTELHNNYKGLELVSIVVRVLKSLNWGVARTKRFRQAVESFGFGYSIDSFRMIVSIFAFAEMHDEVHALLRDVMYYYQQVKLDLSELLPTLLDLSTDVKTLVYIVDVLIKVYTCNSLVENAIDVVHQAKIIGIEPGVCSCNFLLKKFAELNKRDYLLTLYGEMKKSGPSPSVYTYTIMMAFYCKMQDKVDMEQATVIYEEMLASGISPSVVTYSTYIHGLCRVGCAEFAWGVIQELKRDDQPLNIYCYNPILRAFCKEGKLYEAILVFEEMKSSRVAPDVFSYSILIEGFCESGHVLKGHSLFEEMKSSGIKPSLVTYTSLLKGFCTRGLMKLALDKIVELGSSGCKYDKHAYKILISGFCKQGYLDYACELLEEMIGNNFAPDASDYQSLIHGFCKTGSFDKAVQILNTVQESGTIPDIFSYGIVINGLCQEGKPGKALELLPPMLKSNMIPNIVIYSTLIYGFAKQSNFEKALILYTRMKKCGVTPDLVASTIYLNILLSEGIIDEAYNFFNKMIREGPEPDKITYTSIINGFCKSRSMSKALDLFKEMVQKDHSPSVVTYNVLIQGYLRQGQKDKACKILEVMDKEGIVPDDVLLEMLGLYFNVMKTR